MPYLCICSNNKCLSGRFTRQLLSSCRHRQLELNTSRCTHDLLQYHAYSFRQTLFHHPVKAVHPACCHSETPSTPPPVRFCLVLYEILLTLPAFSSLLFKFTFTIIHHLKRLSIHFSNFHCYIKYVKMF